MVDWEFKDKYDLNDFIHIIDVLRAPGGCPWDIKQTHESLKRNAVEEAYEVCDAIDEGSMEHLREELGDLLMQVIFHASIEKEKGGFDLDDVSDEACKKLIHRHPHVFADVQADPRRGAGQLGRHQARRPRPAERGQRHGRRAARSARTDALAEDTGQGRQAGL